MTQAVANVRPKTLPVQLNVSKDRGKIKSSFAGEVPENAEKKREATWQRRCQWVIFEPRRYRPGTAALRETDRKMPSKRGRNLAKGGAKRRKKILRSFNDDPEYIAVAVVKCFLTVQSNVSIVAFQWQKPNQETRAEARGCKGTIGARGCTALSQFAEMTEKFINWNPL